MNKKAQAGLEYLVTYGWALVIIATVIGVLVFIVSMPPDIVFASSRPDKLMIKGGSINAGSVEISVQNITGGQIRIVSVELDDQGFIQSIGGSKLNGTLIGPEMTPVEKAEIMKLQGVSLRTTIEPLELTVPKMVIDKELEGKTPSKRLYGVIFVWWDQLGRPDEFEVFYKKTMERL